MRAAAILLTLALSMGALSAGAENAPLTPPRTAAGEALAQDLTARGIDTTLTYAASAQNIAKPKPPPPPEAMALPGGNLSVFWVLGAVAVALGVWLRFGGAGILTRRAPTEGTAPQVPAHWQVEADIPAASLLDQIAAMEDRSAALVRLLRHCLLQAAEATRTRLARADTEREAFARLPGDKPALAVILQAAELAHYGGRPVSDAGFAAALQAGRGLLGARHG
ncbi:DUF4129 domain-containing protein [Rhodobacter sp. KR11]|uniref:DUF4129 domain-containing protein n=1 Tax=Rhodobacter sp. KR11 TaxID=2974588 RepID=UPI00222258D4|nr:DUF4129 domain-containing protein [Rhodobacter sp. KR11]MCW1918294.1 DUF4129 domain-containing protein [Rhodobacter sp. KR11]